MALSVSVILGLVAPQYDSDTDRASFITLATEQTSTTSFGDNINAAIAYRAAHMMTIRDMESGGVGSGLGGGAGAVTQKREGDLSISFGSSGVAGSTQQNKDLILTKYGRMLLGLISGNIVTFAISGEERTDD